MALLTLANNIPGTLGYLIWYSVDNDSSIGYEVFREMIKMYEAPLTIMKAPKPENVFRRACENFRYTHETSTATHEFKITDNGFQKNIVSRSLVATVRTGDISSVTAVVAEVQLDKKTKDVTWIPAGATPSEIDKNAVEFAEWEIAVYMAENAGTLYSLPIRESIRRAIEGPLHGISMKPAAGGVYFIPYVMADELAAMGSVINQIGGANLEYIEVTNSGHTRYMISKYLSTVLGNECSLMSDRITELANLLKGDESVPAKRISEIQEMIDTYRQRIESYDWYDTTSGYYMKIETFQKELDALLMEDENE